MEVHLGALLCKLSVGVDNHASCRAVKDIDTGAANPLLQVIDGKGDVLCICLVEHPNLPIRRRPRDAVSIVMEEHPLVLHRAPESL